MYGFKRKFRIEEINMNTKMTIVITMAGEGSRFRKAGYNIPKYEIMARGKTLFEWSLDSLIDYNKYVDKYIFVVRKEDKAIEFIKRVCEKRKIDNIDIIEIDYLTDGQATTCMLALSKSDSDSQLLVYNIDTYVEYGEMKYTDIKGDGHIPCFHAEGDHWSFVKVDEDGKAVEVREKKRISDNCTLGAYYFSSIQLYKELYRGYYSSDNNIESGEKYIAPLYNYMIQKGMLVTISIVNKDKVHVLGTPEELDFFLK
jgi:dTDP-glucose pyrophosphorylase